MLEIKVAPFDSAAKILVIGVGGGGNNAVNRMINANLAGVEFAAVNTDLAVLSSSLADQKIQIGEKLLRGYGAGADPQLGEAAALESEDDLRALIEGKDMVIITCGMGGGTGTGASPIIAKMCKENGIVTIGVVTTPFYFENTPRMSVAESGVAKLKENVDTLLVIPNDKLLKLSEKPLKLKDAFNVADSILKYTIEGISNIVYNEGIINIDFNDVKTTLLNKGLGHLGIGVVNEDDSVLEAVKQAINSPLLDTTIEGATSMLINTSGDVDIASLNDAICYVKEQAGDQVNIIWGTVSKENENEEKIIVTLIATGMPETSHKEIPKVTFSKHKKPVITPNIPQNQQVVNQDVNPFDIITPVIEKTKPIEIVIPPFLANRSK